MWLNSLCSLIYLKTYLCCTHSCVLRCSLRLYELHLLLLSKLAAISHTNSFAAKFAAIFAAKFAAIFTATLDHLHSHPHSHLRACIQFRSHSSSRLHSHLHSILLKTRLMSWLSRTLLEHYSGSYSNVTTIFLACRPLSRMQPAA